MGISRPCLPYFIPDSGLQLADDTFGSAYPPERNCCYTARLYRERSGVVGVQCLPSECLRVRCCLRMHAPTIGMWCTTILLH